MTKGATLAKGVLRMVRCVTLEMRAMNANKNAHIVMIRIFLKLTAVNIAGITLETARAAVVK